MEVAFSSSFKRAFKKKIKRNKDLQEIFWKKLEKFIEDPFAKELKTHKLTGKLEDSWSFSLRYDLRVIFFFAENKKVVLVDIGTHEEVY
ncbi:MAG: type II toxin-antitoxin system mRNA interferase toxin, RelE/StbE family [Candidatus Desulfofervidaceae bacterium]|nr:type II toxin-antitoxin system mRNA interferase toxin, RelE/StbE family [Candidatus Desulfofervidaceae bacterium]